MPTDRLPGQDGIARPRVIVSVTATADGRVTLSRAERLLDDGPNVRWKAIWPALLRAGLVDELHIITVPALIGGLGTPSVMDGPPLGTGSFPVPLRAVDVQVGAHGTIWAHYEVVALGWPMRSRGVPGYVPG